MLSDLLVENGWFPVAPMELYTDMFRLGEGCIQTSTEAPGSFKTNPIIIGHDGKRMHRHIMFEDTFEQTLTQFQSYEWAFMSGCTYFGRHNTAERQGKLYAMIFDIDGVQERNMENFFHALSHGVYPWPTHIVLSGHGMHLYYVLEEPLELYPGIKTQVKELKYGITRLLWNRYTSTIKNPQFQGINQAFRVPGSSTKPDAPQKVCQAYKHGGSGGCWKPIDITDLNEFLMEPEYAIDLDRRFPRSRVTLSEAKQRWPEWYERVVVGKETPGQWKTHEGLYRWWLEQISTKASVGHRYFCIMMLAIYAAKCGIYDVERVRADAVKLLPYFNEIGKEPFTTADIDSALECLDQRYATFPRSMIEKLTAIRIDPNKRNNRTQEIHLRGARALQQIKHEAEGTDWRYHGGAPTKESVVREWREQHPAGRKVDCERDTGLSRPTVLKWWNSTAPKVKAE